MSHRCTSASSWCPGADDPIDVEKISHLRKAQSCTVQAECQVEAGNSLLLGIDLPISGEDKKVVSTLHDHPHAQFSFEAVNEENVIAV